MGAGWLGWSGYATAGCQNDCAGCRRPLFTPSQRWRCMVKKSSAEQRRAAESSRVDIGRGCVDDIAGLVPSINHSSRPFLCLFHPHTCTDRLFSALRPSSASPAQLCRLITALSAAAEPYACPTLPHHIHHHLPRPLPDSITNNLHSPAVSL
jgi:hypothetical protein